MELQEKKEKGKKLTGKLFRKNKDKSYLLILNFKLFWSYVKEKHSAGREFQNLAVWGETLLT